MATTTTHRSEAIPEMPKPAKTPVKVELLTSEHHPTLGTLERWRMSDGTVGRFVVKVTTRLEAE